MRTETMTCDRCDIKQTGVVRWDEAIKGISVKCPPDGINGGVYTPDLCQQCRTELDALVRDFMREVPR